MTTNTHTLQIEEILELLPHRFPFLLVDRVLDFEEGRFLRAVKNVSVNEPFFEDTSGQTDFAGVLILEAMAQATGILAFKALGNWNPANCIISRVLMKRALSVRWCQRSDDHGSHFRENAPWPDPL